MSRYTVLDTQTGKKITFQWSGDSPPTQSDMLDIFSEARKISDKNTSDVPKWGMESPNLYGLYGAGKGLIEKGVKPSLEALGAGLGSLVTPIAGTAFGFGMGKKSGEILSNLYEKIEKPSQPTTLKGIGKEALLETGKSAIDVGSAMAMGKGMEIIGNKAYPLESKITGIVKKGFEKGVKPTVSGKQTSRQLETYYSKAEDAVKSIIKRSGGEVPKNLNDFSKSVYDTKVKVWNQYHDMAVQSGKSGIKVDLNPVINEMKKIGNSPKLRRVNAPEADRLLKMAEEWGKQSTSITPVEAENLLSELNVMSKSWWKNPNPNDVHAALNYERTANNVRKALIKAIPEGSEYAALRKEYGSLSTIEKEVTNRAIVYGRRNPKGFFDLASIHGTGHFVYGLAKLDPSLMAAGAAMKSAAKLIKFVNSSDRIVGKMFKDAQKQMIKSGEINPVRKNPFIIKSPEEADEALEALRKLNKSF